jgi:hypothetical protein
LTQQGARQVDVVPIGAPAVRAAHAMPPVARQARGAPPRPPSFFGVHWVFAFVVFDLLCVLALIVPGIDPVRFLCRVAVFGGSLALLVFVPAGRFRHPATKPAIVALLVLALGLFHPDTSGPLAAIAAVAMYGAILAPLWWVSGLPVDVALIRRVALTLWLFHTAGAALGVVQMYFPGQFEPEPSAIFLARGEAMVEGARVTLASGQQVFRPMGLTDQPGGAAASGLACIVFALGIWTVERRLWLNLACFASMMCGFFCIYLSQVRSILVMAVVALFVFALVLAWRRDYARLGRYALLALLVLAASTTWAFYVGGEMTINRLLTLIEHDPRVVYYHGRGWALHYTWDAIPRYPFGAGLGRWGMINHYFGAPDPRGEALWAEIQWTGWLFDGGVPLILAYGCAVLLAVWVSWRIAIDRGAGELSLWAAVLCASNVAALAVTFNYPMFMSQGGMEFWLLNACLWAAWKQRQHAPARRAGAAGF